MIAKGLTIWNIFWSKINIRGLDECWEWTASQTWNGYGRFGAGRNHGVSQRAHKVAYMITHGRVPRSLQVLHSCDNPLCCNPCHLSLGTPQGNMLDKVKKGRQSRGVSHGMSRLTEEQVKLIRRDSRQNTLIAKEYKVSPTTIGRIKNRQYWSHL